MNEVSKELVVSLGNKVEDLFGSLAEQIGVGVEHFWPIFVRQQVIYGTMGVIGWVFFAIVIVVLVTIGCKNGKKYDWENGNEHLYMPYLIIAGIIGFILLMYSCIEMPTAVSRVINPEYHALSDIISKVKY